VSLRRHPDITVLASQRVLQGRIFDVVRESVRLPSGLEQDLTLVDHPGAVAIAALDDDGRLVLVKQYRHAAGDWLIEVPAGRIEPGESRPDAALRELEEETGFKAGHLEQLCEFFAAPGFCSEWMTLFLARELRAIPGGGKAKDDDEELEIVRMSPAELLASNVRDAKTLIAAALLA
jgi:ADP-ribose pyrophosphatase